MKNINIYSHLDISRNFKKAWGEEIWIHNDEEYCGKILRFKSGGKFSLHFHIKKKETWYVNKGEFILNLIETEEANRNSYFLFPGDIIEIPPGLPHQLIAQEENSEIFEVSTQHFEEDSYRIEKGDSQKWWFPKNPEEPSLNLPMKITWVNGTFDILHVGHIEFLKYAASINPILIVGIDSDRRVKELKGKNRPINNQEDRKKILKSIKYINSVVIFDTDEELENCLKEFNIHSMVEGTEYKDKRIIGKDLIQEIYFFDRIPEYSSTKIIKNISE